MNNRLTTLCICGILCILCTACGSRASVPLFL